MEKTQRQEVAQRFSAASIGLKACATFLLVASAGLFAQSVPDINYDAGADSINLPSDGEVAGVATNSRGHLFVYARTGHAVATLGDERTFYHGGSAQFPLLSN